MRAGIIALAGLLAGVPSSAQDGAGRVGSIDFFGYKGLPLAAVRAAVPVRPGDALDDGLKARIDAAVRKATGRPATDVTGTCCDAQGNWMLFIGLSGASTRRAVYAPAPASGARLPDAIIDLDRRLAEATVSAVQKGGDAAADDHSAGYSLMGDPAVRALQLELRAWVLDHEPETFAALAASDAHHRAAAALALGYARASTSQVAALVNATRDPHEGVRNNSARALGVLAAAQPALLRGIDLSGPIAMLQSGSWTDRNKGVLLLDRLTVSRDPALLARLRGQAGDALREIAAWKSTGHAISARMILARIQGVPEEQAIRESQQPR